MNAKEMDDDSTLADCGSVSGGTHGLPWGFYGDPGGSHQLWP